MAIKKKKKIRFIFHQKADGTAKRKPTVKKTVKKTVRRAGVKKNPKVRTPARARVKKVSKKKTLARRVGKKVVSKKIRAGRKPKKTLSRKLILPRKARASKYKPVVKIKVIGIGGGGGNALTRMSRDPLRGVEFVAVNTDLQDLESCEARRKIHIGKTTTRGFGAGMNPELGQQSAEENRDEIEAVLQGTDMVFLTAGMGGGTGTGATPIIADVARDMGILTVAVVTKPFSFEGSVRMRLAEEGLAKLKDRVDTLLVIPNDRIFNIIDANTPVLKAFDKIDDILKNSVRGIADMITASGLVNVDFADVSAVMKDAGMAVVGVGVARGKDRAVKAVNEAIGSPLLDISIDGARGVLFSIAGGRDLKMSEVNEAARMVTENVDAGAKIIFGAHHDRKLKKGDFKIILIATGFNGSHHFVREQDGLGLFSEDNEDEIGKTDDDIEYELPRDDRKGEKNGAAKKRKGGEGTEGDGKDKEEVWEIPAFLRRRRRR
ncbi:MAG: cell division protein FtsZ [Candidatus Colwellbacteria bacterium]|nr:cell division protein FtsZ [Candidatus Colwellbacteria bacterium]